MAEDIGFILFTQLLGMADYPGAPFTGNIFRDIIIFFIVPTIFIIMIVYMTVGRIFGGAHAKFRLMLGLGMYLFIIASGYYRAFALLAGPYFVFLIFILGILYFFLEHFTGRGGGGRAPGEYRSSTHDYPVDSKRVTNLLGLPELNLAERNHLTKDLRAVNARISQQERILESLKKHPGTGDTGRVAEQLDRLMVERQALERKLHNR